MKTTKSERGWKLFDDETSAVAVGTPFRVQWFTADHREKFLYFPTREAAFSFAQNNVLRQIQIMDLRTRSVLFPAADAP